MRKLGFFSVGVAVGFCACALAFFALRKDSPAPRTYNLRDDILVHGNKNLKEVALTFDDGPHTAIARKILNALGKEQVKATFFVVGTRVEQNSAIVRRMLNEGHEVGNHTYSHPRLEGMTAEEIKTEIAKCGNAVTKATGAGMNLFRPPGMRYDETVIRTAQDLGYVTIHWNTAAKDFQPLDPKLITERVLDGVQPGSVILLHSHPDTLKALPTILASLKADGYRFVRVSQMLSRLPRPVYVATNAYELDKKFAAKAVAKPSRTVRRWRPVVVARRAPQQEAPKGASRPRIPLIIDVPAPD